MLEPKAWRYMEFMVIGKLFSLPPRIAELEYFLGPFTGFSGFPLLISSFSPIEIPYSLMLRRPHLLLGYVDSLRDIATASHEANRHRTHP
jgi:hypothetical protein